MNGMERNGINEFQREQLLKIHFLVGLNVCLTICIRFVGCSLNQFSHEYVHMGAANDAV